VNGKQFVSTALAILLVSAGLLVFSTHATQTYDWSKPRPTSYKDFNETTGNAATEGTAAVGMGVEVLNYVPSGGPGDEDHLRFIVSVSANTRVGIEYSPLNSQYTMWVYEWVSVPNPTNIIGDSSGTWLDLPFLFLYYGVVYTRIWVCSNGFTCLTSERTDTNPQPIPSNNTPDAIIAPLWRDLKPNLSNSITYGEGTFHGNLCFVVSWNNVPDDDNQPQTFQLVIVSRPPGRGDIHNYVFFQYQNITKGQNTSIGVENRLGLQGCSLSLNNISNAQGWLMSPTDPGSRLTKLKITLTKSDRKARLQPEIAYISGYNVELRNTDLQSYADLFAPPIEFAGALLVDKIVEAGLLTTGAGLVIDGLFLFYDMTSAIASAFYAGANQEYTIAQPPDSEAYVQATCKANSTGGGDEVGAPFDASLASKFDWCFTDSYPNFEPHTLTVTAGAFYVNYDNGTGCWVSTSITLNMYTGYHYVDIYTNLYPSNASISNMSIKINGTAYYSPVQSLILPEGLYTIQLMDTPNYKFDQWADQNGSNPRNIPLTSDFAEIAGYDPIWTLTINSNAGGTTDPRSGTYSYVQTTLSGPNASVTAIPSANFIFQDWYLNGTFYSEDQSVNVPMNANYVLTPCFTYVGGGGRGGSCPYAYAWNGTAFVKDNNILPASETDNGTDTRDYYLLQQPLVPWLVTQRTSLCSIQIREFENNTDYIDQVRLMAVDHSQDASIAVTPEGEIVTYTNPASPVSCVDGYGNNQLPEISSMDGNVSDPYTYYQGFKNDWLLLDFGTVTASHANLILRDDMKCAEDNCIDVQVPDAGGAWRTIEVLNPRDFWSMEAVNLTAYTPANGEFVVRLLWTAPHRLDFVGLDTSLQAQVQVNSAQPKLAVHSTQGIVTPKLLYDDENCVELVNGQQITLWFSVPSQKQATTRSFILYTDGYYYTIEP
jgi:hypothetical protein